MGPNLDSTPRADSRATTLPHEQGTAAGRDIAMTASLALIRDLDGTFAGATAERRAEIARRIADLFEFGAADYSAEQIDLFDDVFARLAAGIEASARAGLAERLAGNPFAPPRVSQILAFDDAIEVAAPLLEQSDRIESALLASHARNKGQDHLLVMSRRRSLDAIVTDVLVQRGDRPVLLSTTRNPGARLSDFGFMTLVERAQGDDELALSVGGRRELPRHYLLKLLAKASAAVRAKLELADPLSSDAIRNAVAGATCAMQASTARESYDYTAARAEVEALRAAGRLSEVEVQTFAAAGRFEPAALALATLCQLPVEQIEVTMAGNRPETMIILAKAIGMSWPTVKALLTMSGGGPGLAGTGLEQCLATYSRLKPATARQVLEFQRRRAAGNLERRPAGGL